MTTLSKHTAPERKQGLSYFSPDEIQQAPENELLYDAFSPNTNDDDYGLYASIKEEGIREPLHISADGVLLSGHRRYAVASEWLDLQEVPVIIHHEYFWSEMSREERLKVLADFNKQRDKSFTEKVREQLLEVDPEDAYHALIADRRGRERKIKTNIDMGDRKRRARITTMDFLNAAKKIIETEKEYWPLTLRRVHYLLLNDPPLLHDKRPTRYANSRNDYNKLSRLLVRARLTGEVPMEAIIDETRSVYAPVVYSNPSVYVRDELQHFLRYYCRDLLRGQQNHIEVVCEKEGLFRHITAVTEDYGIPVTSGKGFASLPPRTEMAKRFTASGKMTLVLLLLTDFDPEGEVIAKTFPRSMRDDFSITNIVPVKVAISGEDVKQHNLPADMEAKESSPNYKKFVEKYGVKVAELDAAPVSLLQEKLRNAIEGCLDMDAFLNEQQQERKDAVEIKAMKEAVVQFIAGRKDG